MTLCYRCQEKTLPDMASDNAMRSREAFRVFKLGSSYRPSKGIQKRNEPGAFGVGARLLELLQPARIRLADKKEIAAALGLRPIGVTQVPVWQVPGWPATMAPAPGQTLPGQSLHR